jgi:PAS domain S-box-containing protein
MAALNNISEKKFETIFEYAPDAIYIADQKGAFIDGNKAAEILTGYKREELIGQSFLKLKLLSPNEIIRAAKLLALNLIGQPTGPDEFTLISKDGSKTLIEIRTFPIETDGNKQTLGIARNITERKQAEKTLRESEEKYRQLIETTNTGFVIIDNQGRVFDANNEYVRLSGYEKKEEILGRKVIEWTADYNLEKNQQAVQSCIENGMIRNLEIDYVDKEGKITPIEINATVIDVKEGKQILTLCRDITERKKTEEKIRESEVKYRALFEASADGILIADIETKKFKFANPAICRMLGYNQDELCQMSIVDIHPKKDLPYVISEFEAQAKKEKILAEKIPCLRKDGGIFYADINTTQVTLNGHQCNVGLFRDITGRQKAEEELRIKNKDLERFNKLAVDRELKMIELKKKIKELEERITHS